MNPISQLFYSLPHAELPVKQISEQVQFCQNEMFFRLAASKESRIQQLKQYFAEHGLRKIYLSGNIAGFKCQLPQVTVEILESGYFQRLQDDQREDKKAQLAGCVVIINNNDLSDTAARAAYADFYSECTSTCFIAWDWDNHHWLELSTFLAAHTDIYAPAHHENLYLLTRYNWLTCGPVYCSSVQWPRAFLTEHLPSMLQAERSDAPLGMHIPYAQFNFRLQVITTLNQHYSTIGFSSRTFHVRTPEDRLKEWYSHKTHWIAPVLNDVPIRIFDALITGGIPIVPASLRLLPPVNQIPREFIEFYTPMDIVQPKPLIERANALFDQGGIAGMQARHQFALQHHHGDVSVQMMLDYATEVLNIRSAP